MSPFQIIVPMSGLGSRFAEAGYTEIKPLIKVQGKPIIEWVCDLFPGNHRFLFICREEHLKHTSLRSELQRIRPQSEIVSIAGHKLGPVYAVHAASDYILDDIPAVINYCDFFMNWNFADFIKTVEENQCDGAVPCYTGFHPHLMHPQNVYAVCREEGGWLKEIKEKYRFHSDPFENNHSAGTYYFQKGEKLKKWCAEMLERKDLALNGEYYASLLYTLMLEQNAKVWVYKGIEHFCQWGTPNDLQEFNDWAKIIKHYQLNA